MPSVPPDSRGTAEYRRSSQNASTPSAISAASRPARAVAASAACRPRRARAVPGVTGRSDGPHHHHDDAHHDDRGGPPGASGDAALHACRAVPPAEPAGSPLADMSRFAR